MASGEPRQTRGGPLSPSALRVLGSRIDCVTLKEALALLRGFLQTETPHHVITGNTLMLLTAEQDRDLQHILENAALVVPESAGILWACRRLGAPLDTFTPGIDLLGSLCRLAEEKGFSVFLLGSSPGVAEAAGKALTARFPKLAIVGTFHGYFGSNEEATVLECIRQAQPAILFVGMGMPAQEKWIARNLKALEVPVVMGVGGSFDVLSGKLKRAPALMRRMGIEWMYRLIQEPWRWRRIAQLPVFAWKVLQQK